NILAYATGMQPPRPRLTQVAVTPVPKQGSTPLGKRGYLQVGQIWFKGEWQPAPKAMTHVLDHVRNYANVDVILKPDKVDIRDEDVLNYKFLYLHGRLKPGEQPFPSDAKELELLQFNLTSGGLLLADACCGDKEFDKAFRTFAGVLFPEQNLEQFLLNDVLSCKGLNRAEVL